jgi:hypothetical protein
MYRLALIFAFFSSMAACAAPRRVCSAEICAAWLYLSLHQLLLPMNVSVQHQLVLMCYPGRVCSTAACSAPGLFSWSLCCPQTYLFYNSLCLAHFFKIRTSWVGRDSPLQIVLAVWCFLYLKKVCQMNITICRVLSYTTTATRSLSRIVCRGRRAEGNKGTLRPDL